MDILLDTHILLWWLTDPEKLSDAARRLIEDTKINIYISSVVIWEIMIKKKLGKLTVPDNFIEVLYNQGFLFLPITEKHALNIEELPDIHRDPFDRMLISQAKSENLLFITRDAHSVKYDIQIVQG